MVSFQAVKGDLYVGESAEEDDRIDSEKASEMYSQVVFVNDQIDLRFYSGIGGYIPFSEDSVVEEYGDKVYYPYYNETVAEVAINTDQDLELYEEDVSLLYALVEGDMYVKSESEITAYGGNHLVAHEQVYKVVDPLITKPTGESDRDEFLDVDSVEKPVRVKNVETGVKVPINYDKIVDLNESERTGALKIREPDAVLTQAFNTLRDG